MLPTSISSNSNKVLQTRKVDATPYASALIEGHRDFGYNLETALADIIDNSISANASEVKLVAETTSETPWLAIIDDGCGMTEHDLVEAMRLGAKNPTSMRTPRDLGRFGLGMKSASFSQCRCLTVMTRHRDALACAQWNLDRIARENDWTLELIDDPDPLGRSYLLASSGTVVFWDNLDRMMGGHADDPVKRTATLNSELSRAERHLRLVFHRFLEGNNPRLKLFLNGRRLTPIDPMAKDSTSGQWDPPDEIVLEQGVVKVRCRTLPHHKMVSKEQWNELGGPEGHLKSQGLYVYREDRLIIAGSWLGLAKQTELTKLCRISVDIPNTMDADWKIDVKKASAQLPPVVRERLKKVIERFVGTSKRTYQRRGQKLVDETRLPVWNRVLKDGHVIFRPNLEHPVFQTFSAQLPEELHIDFQRCLRLIGSSLPIETLHAELVGNAEAVVADAADKADLELLVRAIGEALTAGGASPESLSEIMQSHQLLRDNWAAAEPIIKEFIREIS
ncbi:ATP-binding protein [Roseibium aestuarii]|uniref:ATP-binding protein n=1 Tax=Roseibium aestuarii TaxID=2600299 RepID=A0ABW4JWB5_9HYPH|nr:ATP-binding protein [Roseibium aestuarii]